MTAYGYYTLQPDPKHPTINQANEAIRQMGTNAVPIFLRMLEQPDSTLKQRFLKVFNAKQRFLRIPNPPGNRHFHTLNGFRLLGASASNAVPRLIRIFDTDPSPFPQHVVPVILAHIGWPARQAIPAMVRGTTHTNEVVRNNCIYAISQIQGDPKLVVPALVKCLKDPEPNVRAQAAWALGTFGEDAKPAVPALLALVKETSSNYIGSVPTYVASDTWGTFPSAPASPVGCARNALKQIDPEAIARANVEQ